MVYTKGNKLAVTTNVVTRFMMQGKYGMSDVVSQMWVKGVIQGMLEVKPELMISKTACVWVVLVLVMLVMKRGSTRNGPCDKMSETGGEDESKLQIRWPRMLLEP
jgi:hypothetical protein